MALPARIRSASDIAAETVEKMYRFADTLKGAERALGEVPFGHNKAFDELLDKPLCPGEFDTLAAQVRVIADNWQAEIDAASEGEIA